MRIRIIGQGRAGGSLARALEGRATVEALGRGDHTDAVSHVDVLILAVPDRDISRCAAGIAPGQAVVAHLSGATPLSALAPHHRVASLHPLVSLPDPVEGARRMRGAWMAVAGDPLINEVAGLLDGRTFEVDDANRALYHATATIAANHLVALMGQVERLAALIDLPVRPFLDLAVGALANTIDSGATAALTGPVARQDWSTIRQHLAALPVAEHAMYLTLVGEVATLTGHEMPVDLGGER